MVLKITTYGFKLLDHSMPSVLLKGSRAKSLCRKWLESASWHLQSIQNLGHGVNPSSCYLVKSVLGFLMQRSFYFPFFFFYYSYVFIRIIPLEIMITLDIIIPYGIRIF